MSPVKNPHPQPVISPSASISVPPKVEKTVHSPEEVNELASLGVHRISTQGIPQYQTQNTQNRISQRVHRRTKHASNISGGNRQGVITAQVDSHRYGERSYKDSLFPKAKASASLPVGTISKAQTIIPLVFEGNNQPLKMLLELKEPLGKFPSGTYVVADVQYKNRVVTAFVTGVIENNQLLPIPSKNILILGKNNQPLMAESQRGGGFPLGAMILEGLGTALEVNNLPDFTSTISNGTSTITQSSEEKDMVSGFVEGALEPLREQFKRQRPLSSSFSYLPPQTEVVLFVQSPVELR